MIPTSGFTGQIAQVFFLTYRLTIEKSACLVMMRRYRPSSDAQLAYEIQIGIRVK
jgi:hypothetical protein